MSLEESLPQQKALAIVPKISAILSLFGSLYIVSDVYRMPAPMRKLYHRLMLGMSLLDCLSSAAFFLTTWPIPPNLLPMHGASGNEHTCSAQGYFVQLSISTVLYNGSLACYYFLVIRRGWTDRQLLYSKVEYWLHSLPVLFGLGTATVSAVLGLFHPNRWNCWISSLPLGCQGDDCLHGDHNHWFQWGFFFIPLWMTNLFVLIVMSKIFLYFYNQEKQNNRWNPIAGSTAMLENSKENSKQQNSMSGQFNSHSGSLSGLTRGHSRIKRNNSNRSLGAMSIGSVITTRRSSAGKKKNRAQEIRGQASWFVGSMLVVWIFPTILRIHERVLHDRNVRFHWVLLSAMFWPSQGWFNFLVYMRPRYLKVLKARQRRRHMAAALMQDVEYNDFNYDDQEQRDTNTPHEENAVYSHDNEQETKMTTENETEIIGLEADISDDENDQTIPKEDDHSRRTEEASGRVQEEGSHRTTKDDDGNNNSSKSSLHDDGSHRSVNPPVNGNTEPGSQQDHNGPSQPSTGHDSLTNKLDDPNRIFPFGRNKTIEVSQRRMNSNANPSLEFRKSATTSLDGSRRLNPSLQASGRLPGQTPDQTKKPPPRRRRRPRSTGNEKPQANIRTPRAARINMARKNGTGQSSAPLRRYQTTDNAGISSRNTHLPVRRTSTSESHRPTPNHIRRVHTEDDMSVSEIEGYGSSPKKFLHNLLGKAGIGKSQMEASKSRWNAGLKPKPLRHHQRATSVPYEPSGMGQSMGNASNIFNRFRARSKSRDPGTTSRQPREGRRGLSRAQSALTHSTNLNSVSNNPWLASAEHESGPGLSRAKTLGGPALPGNLTRANSYGERVGQQSDTTNASGHGRRMSSGGLLAWMTLTGVREFAEDIATMMKEGDGGLGASWVGHWSEEDGDGASNPGLSDVASNPGLSDIASNPRLSDIASIPELSDIASNPALSDMEAQSVPDNFDSGGFET